MPPVRHVERLIFCVRSRINSQDVHVRLVMNERSFVDILFHVSNEVWQFLFKIIAERLNIEARDFSPVAGI